MVRLIHVEFGASERIWEAYQEAKDAEKVVLAAVQRDDWRGARRIAIRTASHVVEALTSAEDIVWGDEDAWNRVNRVRREWIVRDVLGDRLGRCRKRLLFAGLAMIAGGGDLDDLESLRGT